MLKQEVATWRPNHSHGGPFQGHDRLLLYVQEQFETFSVVWCHSTCPFGFTKEINSRVQQALYYGFECPGWICLWPVPGNRRGKIEIQSKSRGKVLSNWVFQDDIFSFFQVILKMSHESKSLHTLQSSSFTKIPQKTHQDYCIQCYATHLGWKLSWSWHEHERHGDDGWWCLMHFDGSYEPSPLSSLWNPFLCVSNKGGKRVNINPKSAFYQSNSFKRILLRLPRPVAMATVAI